LNREQMTLTAAVTLPVLAPRHRQDATCAWLDQVERGDYVIVTTTNGTAVTGIVAEASKATGVWLYDHDDAEETRHDEEWYAPAEDIYSAGHVVPPDRWDMAWTHWPWDRMRHLRPACGRTASGRVRARLRSVLGRSRRKRRT